MALPLPLQIKDVAGEVKDAEGESPEKWYGLTLFWEVVQQSDSATKKGKDWIVPPGIGKQALGNFLKLLSSEFAISQRPRYMERFRKYSSLSLSLSLYEKQNVFVLL